MAFSGGALGKVNVVICDDSITNVLVMNEMLKTIDMNLSITSITDPRKVMAELEFDVMLVILDLEMPHLSGYQVLELIRARYSSEELPVIVVSGLSDQKSHIKALKGGANDFVCKPFNEYELKLRVMNQLNIIQTLRLQTHLNQELESRVLQRTFELDQATEFLINKLAIVAELHDETTGKHIIRVGKYSGLLARKLGLNEQIVYMIEKAAPMHDIGKLMISHEVLVKPDKLSNEEFLHMQQHVDKVNVLFDDHPSMMIQMAQSIAIHHHEKWDGSGYSKGLTGQSIPIEGRIVCIADVFDALTTKRPYKPAWSFDESINYLKEQAGSHFDPQLVELFVGSIPEIKAIQEEYKDD